MGFSSNSRFEMPESSHWDEPKIHQLEGLNTQYEGRG
jgi:hypothetical protein